MLATTAQITLAPTMFWVYAATALLIVLFVLLTAPYFGILGERDIDIDPESSDSAGGS